ICADDQAARAQQAQSMFGFESSTTDWRAVIDHPEVQVINIASPNFLHKEMALAAIAAGKHLFCEKPIGRYPEETIAVAEAAQRAGVFTGVGFNYRWAPLVQYTLRLVRDGKLGELTHYRGRFYSMYGSDPYGQLTWRFQFDKAGYGVLGDIMIHVVDMAHMLAGPIDRLVSQRHIFIKERPLPVPGKGTHFSVGQPGDPTGPVENEDYVGTLVVFANGVQGTLETSRTVFGPKCEMAFELYGTRGAVKWNFERMNELQVYLPDEETGHDGFTTILGGPDHPFHGRFNPGPGIGMGYDDLKTIEAFHFLKSIVDGEQIEPGFRNAYTAARTNQAMIRSWESGTWEAVVL
ncbi:MAG: Gfo/Idh/MocA family oxidoreductase, partial [Caldilineaceae bacterium]|nr:Gfo/Idh/MocA family oxidoreductase [Caldilineaceae bacterium]